MAKTFLLIVILFDYKSSEYNSKNLKKFTFHPHSHKEICIFKQSLLPMEIVSLLVNALNCFWKSIVWTINSNIIENILLNIFLLCPKCPTCVSSLTIKLYQNYMDVFPIISHRSAFSDPKLYFCITIHIETYSETVVGSWMLDQYWGTCIKFSQRWGEMYWVRGR